MIPSHYHCPECGAERTSPASSEQKAGPSYPKACAACLRSNHHLSALSDTRALAHITTLRCSARTMVVIAVAAEEVVESHPGQAAILALLIPEHFDEEDAGIRTGAAIEDDAGLGGRYAQIPPAVAALRLLAITCEDLTRTRHRQRSQGQRPPYSPTRARAAKAHVELAAAVLEALA